MDWSALNDWWRTHATWQTLYLLFLGQVVSFVLALMSFTSSLIANLGNNLYISDFVFAFLRFFYYKFFFFCVGVDTPLTQTLIGYFFLALVYGSILLHRRKRLLVIKFVFFFITKQLYSTLH
jgi:solute carrier family 35 protein F1/2